MRVIKPNHWYSLKVPKDKNIEAMFCWAIYNYYSLRNDRKRFGHKLMINDLLELGKTNPMLSGLLGVYVGGVLTWTLRNVPSSIYNFVMSRIIIRFSLLDHGSECYWCPILT